MLGRDRDWWGCAGDWFLYDLGRFGLLASMLLLIVFFMGAGAVVLGPDAATRGKGLLLSVSAIAVVAGAWRYVDRRFAAVRFRGGYWTSSGCVVRSPAGNTYVLSSKRGGFRSHDLYVTARQSRFEESKSPTFKLGPLDRSDVDSEQGHLASLIAAGRWEHGARVPMG